MCRLKEDGDASETEERDGGGGGGVGTFSTQGRVGEGTEGVTRRATFRSQGAPNSVLNTASQG